MSVLFSFPNIKGFPGLMATFQNINFIPNLVNTLFIKSCFPTDAPPVLISILYLFISFNFLVIDAELSLAIPRSKASPPILLITVCNNNELDEIIPFLNLLPAILNSLPLESIAILGFFNTSM